MEAPVEEGTNVLSAFGLTRTQLDEHIQSLSPADRKDVFRLIRTMNEKLYYQMNPAQWMEDVLHIPVHTLIWSMNPGYIEGGYVDEEGNLMLDAWDGTPDPIKSILDALARWEDVAVESATGVGKTFLAAAIVLWFLANFPGARVITTAPKNDLIKKNLWGEIGKLWPKFHARYQEAEKIDLLLRMAPEGDELRDIWTAFGFVASVGADEDSASKAQGFHAEHMLIVVDEATGMPEAMIESFENTSTAPHNLRLFLGNPSALTDPLHKFAQTEGVTLVRVSAYDHPNVVGNDEHTDFRDHIQVIHGAVSWKSIFSRRNRYGPEPEYYNAHPLYRSRVRGICPSGSTHSLFTAKVLAVVEQHLTAHPTVPVVEVTHRAQGGEFVEGWTRIYEPRVNSHISRYVIFADVADDVGNGDYHSGIVLDRITRTPVCLIHMRGHRRYFALELLRVAELYSIYDWRGDSFWPPVLCWERNAAGALHLITEFAAYPELYRPKVVDRPKAGKPRNAYGWYTSSKNRDDMVAELEDWGLELREEPWRVTDRVIYDEMCVFEWHDRKRRYQHRDGQHDDIMMALAGALVISKVLPEPMPIPDEPPGEGKQRHKDLQDAINSCRRSRKPPGNEYGSRFASARVKQSKRVRRKSRT